jgi:glycosyltransferase involved in cell wall biosynthesis
VSATVLYLHHGAQLSGAERSLLLLLDALDRERFEPVVALPDDGPFARRLEESGIPVERIDLDPASWRRPVRLVADAVRLARTVRRTGARIVHANSFLAAKQAILTARSLGVPLVASVRDIVPFTRPTRLALLACDRVLCVSEATARNLVGESLPCPNHVRVVYNGVATWTPPAGFDAAAKRAELGLTPDGGPFVGMVSPLVAWKGQRVFLEAARLVRERTGRGTFLLAGDASFSDEGYVAELHRLASRPPLDERSVRWLGFRADVAELLASWDVVVCPSVEPDPLPRAVLEAMAAGRPVVASDCGGIPEAIAHGRSGLLVPPGDAGALADRLIELFERPDVGRELGAAARGVIEHTFGVDRHRAAVQAIYDELLETT